MARYAKIFNNFTGGEISPLVYGRTDLEQYRNGCEVLENFIPLGQGGVMLRPGTWMASDLGSNTTFNATPDADTHNVKIIPFAFSQDTGYVVMLHYGEGIRIETSRTGPGGSNLCTDNSSFSSDFSSSDLLEVQYTQSANELFIVHPDHKPIVLTRTGAASFVAYDWDDSSRFETVSDQVKAIPIQDINTTSTTITPSGTTGSVVLTASENINWGDYVRLDGGGSSGIAAVQSTTSGSIATATVLSGFNLPGGANTDWYMSSWGSLDLYGDLGYPRTTTIFQGRLFFGGNNAFPDTMWFSESFNFRRFLGTKLDQWGAEELQTGNAAAIQAALNSGQVNQIQWAVDAGKGDLALGTLGAEFIGYAPDSASGFGASNLRFERHTNYGSDYVQAAMVGDTPVFVAKGGKSIRSMEFKEASGKYLSGDLTALAGHLLESAYSEREDQWNFDADTTIAQYNTFRELNFDRQFNCLWAVSTFGDAYACYYDRNMGIAAWSRIRLGGTYNTDQSPKIHSIAPVPQRLDAYNPNPGDLIYFAASRDYGDSQIATTTEYIAEVYDRSDIDVAVGGSSGVNEVAQGRYPVFTDFSLLRVNVTDSSPEATGLDGDFAGTQFSYVGDGTTYGTISLTDPVATDAKLEYDQSFVTAISGFRYTHKLRTTKIEEGSQIGSAQGLTHRIHKAIIRLYRSAQLKVGDFDEPSKMEEITFDRIDKNSSKPIALFSGDKEVDMPSAYGSDPYVYIEGDEPLPLNIAAIIAKGEVYEG
tara:strand:- start:6914 stop:9193 length:2280 start_codon:yes stop_codon:yes gene_type:complete